MQYQGGWSISKYQEEQSSNEDNFAVSSDASVCALSDGASDSFDSANWSRLLVASYLAEPLLSPEWVEKAVAEYNRRVNRSELSWSAQGGFDRGSFATLLGIRAEPGGVTVEALGDSIVIVADGSDKVISFPYTTSEQFKQFPALISTRSELNVSLFENGPDTWRARISFASLSAPAIFVMSDALGEWALAAGRDAVKSLRSIKTQRQFEKLVARERKHGRLRRDDTTLVGFR
jgi:hypothetical protein